MDKIPPIDTLSSDLLNHVFSFTESYAAESLVSKGFCESSSSYFYHQLRSIVRNDISDDFDSLIDRQEGDTWYVTNQKAIKYFNNLCKLTGFAPIVLPKQNGEYFSTNLISTYRVAYQNIVDRNFITCFNAMTNKDIQKFIWDNKITPAQELPALFRKYLQERDATQEGCGDLKMRSDDVKNLTLFPSEICECTPVIEYLNLCSNPLRTLPMSFNKLVNLSILELTLDQKPLEKFPSALLKVTSLKTLNLNGGKGIKFPETLGNLTTLTSFNLKTQPLEDLPHSISSLVNLTWFNLDNTPIKNLSSCLFRLSNLRTLIIGSFKKPMEVNEPMNFPESFDRLTSLTSLSFACYPITNLPESLSCLTNLTQLNLINTKMAILPPSILRLTNLCKLFFEGAPIDEEYKKTNDLSNRLHEGLPKLKYPKPFPKPWDWDLDSD